MILLPQDFWEIRKTGNKGRGVFARKPIEKRKLIAQYTGKVVHYTDIDLEKYDGYLMDYDEEHAIVPHLEEIGAHLFNHSCNSNCFIYPHESHIFFTTVKDITPNEELTIHYLYPPLSFGCKNCTHKCSCGSEICTGSMHMTEEEYAWWQKFLKS